jgi:hypothetical protein
MFRRWPSRVFSAERTDMKSPPAFGVTGRSSARINA